MTDRGDIFALSVRPEVRGIAWNNYSSSDDDVGMRWRSSSNLSITPERALQSTVVISCCRIISESIAGLPLSLYRKRENGSREIASELHLHKVLSFAPNNWQTKFEFVEQICMNLLLWGNSYSLIESGQHGAVESLHNLHPSRMRVERIENGRLRYTYTNPQSGRVEKYTQDAIMHIRWTPEPDGMRGMVPVEISRDAIALARSLEIHASKFWANAARPGTVLTHPGNLSSEAAEKLRDNWERAHMGSEKSYKTAVLTGGLQVTELGFTNEASQFVASRTFQTEEICRIYRLPLHLVQGTSSGSLEVQGQEFVTWTLAPWLERIQSAISRSLIYNDDLFVAGFDTRGLLRADSGSRASYYSTCTNLGILSINECRSMEGLPPLGPEADNHFIGMNQQTIQDAAKPKVAPDPSLPPPPATNGVPSLPGVATGAPPSPSEIGVASAVKNPDKRAWCEGDVGEGGVQDNSCGSAGGLGTDGKFDVQKLLAKIASPDSAEGFSLDVLTADQPETGIMVSTFQNHSERSTRIQQDAIHTDAAAKILKDFIEHNASEIIGRPDRYIGGWLDGKEFYLDIATRFDPDKAVEALEAGRASGQLAVFNLGTFKETYIHYPSYDTRRPRGWDKSFARAKKKAGNDHAELDVHGRVSVRKMEVLALRGYTDAESRAILLAIEGTEEDHNHGRGVKETGGYEGGRADRRQQAGSVPRDEGVGRTDGEKAGEDTRARVVRRRARRFARFIRLSRREARAWCKGDVGEAGVQDNSCSSADAATQSPEASAALASPKFSDSVTHNAVASPPTQRSSDGKTLIASSAVPEIIRSGPGKNCYSFGGREYLSTVAAGQHLESQQAANRGGVVINTKKPLTGDNLEYMVASHVAQAEQAKSRNITPLFYTAGERANQLVEYAKINPAIMGGRAKAGFEVTPEVGEFIFRVAQAQTSPNASPAINMDRADAIINKVLKGDGRFTTSTIFGVTGKSIKGGLSRFQAIVDTLGKRTDGSIDTAAGLEAARQLLVGQTAPAGQFEELFADQLGKQGIKWKPGNYLVAQEVPLFSTFGPKVGPFFENNYGNLNHLTADVWATRTFTRDSGELVVPPNKDNARKYAGELEKVLRSATDEQFHGVNTQDLAADVNDMKTSGLVGDTLRAWAGARLRHYAAGDYKEKRGQAGAANKAAKKVVENDVHLMGAPSGGNVRANLITVYQEAAKRTGLEVANLQDVLWQDEQDAYAATGAKTSTATGIPSFYSTVIRAMAGSRKDGKKPMLARRDTLGENVISAGFVDDYDKGGREELLWGIGLSGISDQEFADRVIGLRSSSRSRDASLGEARAWCNTGEGGGLDNSCSSVPHTSFLPHSGDDGPEWGRSNSTERHGTRYGDPPLFRGAEKIGEIEINHAKDVKDYIHDALGSTLPEVVSAAGVAVGTREGVKPPRLVVSLGQDGLDVTWVSNGTSSTGEKVVAASANRTVAAGKKIILHSYDIHPDFRGKGLPLESVARMVYESGASELEMPVAARASGWVPDGETRKVGEMSGYRVWPKYGFDARLDQVSPDFSRALANSPHADVATLQALLLRPEGKEFWLEHGDSVKMEFDLRPRSRSRDTLEKLMEKWKYGRG